MRRASRSLGRDGRKHVEVRRATGGHPFRPFALALWCATLVAVRADADAALVERIERTIAANRDFAEDTVAYLGQIYGTDVQAVLDLARQDKTLAEPLNAQGDILAQAVYAARHEMALTLKDIVLHRTGIATLGNPGEAILQRVARAVADDLAGRPPEQSGFFALSDGIEFTLCP